MYRTRSWNVAPIIITASQNQIVVETMTYGKTMRDDDACTAWLAEVHLAMEEATAYAFS